MRLFFSTIIIFVLLLSPLPSAIANDGQTNDLIVSTDVLHLRQGPGLSYPIVDTLERGEGLQTIEKQGDWIQVKINGQTGWVASWLTTSAKAKSTSSVKTVISQVNFLNLRAEPSLSASVLTQLSQGSEAQYIQQQNDWIQVQFEGYTGWVVSNYVSLNDHSVQQFTATASTNVSDVNIFTVNVDTINIRKKPSLDSKKLGVATKGTQYKILSRENNWVQIQYKKDTKAWVYSFYGTFTNESDSTTKEASKKSSATDANGQVTIIYNGTNIREQASTSANVIYLANAGENFAIVAQHDDWYEIELENGTAFVADWVVSTNEQQKSTTKEKKSRKIGTLNGVTIVLDPGHGGNDHGTTGVRGTAEKDINLLTVELLKSKLSSAGATVIVTRESDQYVDLRKRVSISNMNNADAFISIHYDATEDSSVKGFTTYYTNSYQKELGEYIHAGLGKQIDLNNRGVQYGNYLVTRENRQPAVLVELGYLSNADEERTVNGAYYREQATLGIYKGILNYFDNQLEN